MTVSQAVLFESFPREEAGTAMALFGLGVMVGPTIGPTLGGWLTDNYGWPWIFYINLPVGILAAMMIAAYVHDSRAPAKADGDRLPGHRAARGQRRRAAVRARARAARRLVRFAPDRRGSTTIGVVGGIALLWRELTTDHPVIDFRVMRHRQMWVGTLLGVVMGVGLYAMSFTLPVFLQSNLRMTARADGHRAASRGDRDSDLDGGRRTADQQVRSANSHHDRRAHLRARGVAAVA